MAGHDGYQYGGDHHGGQQQQHGMMGEGCHMGDCETAANSGDGGGGSIPQSSGSGYESYDHSYETKGFSSSSNLGGLTPFCIAYYIILPLFLVAMIGIIIYYCRCQCRCCSSRRTVPDDARDKDQAGQIPTSVAVVIPNGSIKADRRQAKQHGPLPIAKEIQLQKDNNEAVEHAVPIDVVPLANASEMDVEDVV